MPKDPRDFHATRPDPSYIGGVAEVPFVRLPDPSNLFASRARRFAALAPGHVMEPFLRFLGQVAQAQADACAALPPPAPLPPEQLAPGTEHGMPPLAPGMLQDAAFARTLAAVLHHLDLTGAPDAARTAAEAVRALPPHAAGTLAADLMQGSIPADRVAEALFVSAAVQVHLARLAAGLAPESVPHVPEGVCPACGGPPVSSLVVGWTQASKARYCACALCGTLWNHVRIRCTACGSTEGIAYLAIEGGPGAVGVEACGVCRSYIKHMQQHQDPALDPVADDVASYALDLLAQQDEYRRAGFNPLFVSG